MIKRNHCVSRTILLTGLALLVICSVGQGAGQRVFAAPFPIQQESIPSVQQLQEEESEHFRIPETDAGLPGAGPIRRYDWFQRLWQERRSQWAQQAEQDQNAIVFLGDSITQGWGAEMGNKFAPAKVANRGISGDTTRGMLIRLNEDVLALHPSAVVLLAGTNDLEEKATPEQIAANMKQLIDRLHRFDQSMPVVLCLVFPSSASKSRPSEQIRQINQLYRQVVKDRDYVTVVDTWKLFADSAGDAPKDLFPDLLHPNAAGYEKWGAALRPFLETLQQIEVKSAPADVEDGFVSLFNGRNLTGWSYQPSSDEDRRVHANWKKGDPNAPDWPMREEAISHQGKIVTEDGRYRAVNGRLVVCYPPEGRKIQQIWTEEVFQGDLTLRLEFRAMPNADSGVFVLGRQLQCRDYLRAGPYNDLEGYRDLDWNQLEVVVRDGKAHCTCNGVVLESDWEVPAEGRMGLEGDRGQIEYRNIRLRKD